MIESQVEAYTLKHKKPQSIDELIADGYIKENQKIVNQVLLSQLTMVK